MNSVSSQVLAIKVTKWEKVEGGFLERAHIRFTVEVPVLNSTVYRRFSEFEWMRTTLGTMNPGCPLPPLPKKGKVVHYEDKYLTKRMYILEKQLNSIAKVPELGADLLF